MNTKSVWKQEKQQNPLKVIISRDFVVLLFLDTFEYGKCLETGEMTKSLEYGMCLETGEMTKSLDYGKCLETGETTKSLEYGNNDFCDRQTDRQLLSYIKEDRYHQHYLDLYQGLHHDFDLHRIAKRSSLSGKEDVTLRFQV